MTTTAEMRRKDAKDNAVYLVDASVYIFRAWFALPDTLTGRDGQPINAVHGFAVFLADFLRRVQPGEVAIAFDESLESSHRNEIYPAYKANREPAPPELKAQFRACRELASALGLATFASSRYEADDLIGTLATRARGRGRPVVILTRDKDLAQLVGVEDCLWDFAGDVRMDSAGVLKRFGVRPDQMLDYQALMGDAVDNVPGVRGVGAATAARLLQSFERLDTVYESLDAVERMHRGPRLRRLLEDGRESALLSRELCRIVLDAPLPPEADDLGWRAVDSSVLDACCESIGLAAGVRRNLRSLADTGQTD